jgi:hypothetical protein
MEPKAFTGCHDDLTQFRLDDSLKVSTRLDVPQKNMALANTRQE